MAISLYRARRSVRLLRTPLHHVLRGISSMYFLSRRVKNAIRYELSDLLSHPPTVGSISEDVQKLGKKPKHRSAILEASKNASIVHNTARLIREAVEFTTWCACAGIRTVYVYERQGPLKQNTSQIHELMLERFETCFPEDSPAIYVLSPREEPNPLLKSETSDQENFKLYLIAGEDDWGAVAELTQVLAKKIYAGEVDMDDVSMQFIQKELEEIIMPKPDLLVVSGGHIDLCGYPPWQSRSAELSCLRDNRGFRYQVFFECLEGVLRGRNA